MFKQKGMILVGVFIWSLGIPFLLHAWQRTNIQDQLDIQQRTNIQEQVHKRVMIDPGHGGFDPGKIGVSGVYEKDINLEIAKEVKIYLEKNGVEVVMTRESDEDLDGMEGKAHKSKDMQKRKNLINESKADLLISIHQNAFTDPEVKGFQVFYYTNSVGGQKLARAIDGVLKERVNPQNRRKIKSTNNYYVLRVTRMPAIIVECGFLSNHEEEALLQTSTYRKQIAKAIGAGIIKYFSETTTTKLMNSF